MQKSVVQPGIPRQTARSSEPAHAAARLPTGITLSVRTVTARLVQIAFLGNILIITGLWYGGGNVTAVHSQAAMLTSISRISGLLAAYFLLIQVLLLARLPFLNALAGFDRLAVWHKWNGRLTVVLMLAHVGFVIAGYALMDRLSWWAETVQLWSSYPGMIAGFIGTGLLLLVGFSSAVILRRRVRYEAWYLVHLMAYVGILLAWFHQIPTGNELVIHPVAAAYWTALYVATLQLVIAFRVIQPLLKGLWHGMKVTGVTVEGPGVVSLAVTGRHLNWMDVKAGQFFLWRFLTPGLALESHPFSLSSAPTDSSLRTTVKALGDFTGKLARIKPGTRVIAEGPFGRFTADSRTHDRSVLIAGGIGITPIRALAEELTGPVTVIYRAMNLDEVVFREELEELAKREGVTVHFVTGDHRLKENRHLMTPTHLKSLAPQIVGSDIYICGPSGMMKALRKSLRRLGVTNDAIHTDEFSY